MRLLSFLLTPSSQGAATGTWSKVASTPRQYRPCYTRRSCWEQQPAAAAVYIFFLLSEQIPGNQRFHNCPGTSEKGMTSVVATEPTACGKRDSSRSRMTMHVTKSRTSQTLKSRSLQWRSSFFFIAQGTNHTISSSLRWQHPSQLLRQRWKYTRGSVRQWHRKVASLCSQASRVDSAGISCLSTMLKEEVPLTRHPSNGDGLLCLDGIYWAITSHLRFWCPLLVRFSDPDDRDSHTVSKRNGEEYLQEAVNKLREKGTVKSIQNSRSWDFFSRFFLVSNTMESLCPSGAGSSENQSTADAKADRFQMGLTPYTQEELLQNNSIQLGPVPMSNGIQSTADIGPAGAGSSENRSTVDIRADRFSSWVSLPTLGRSCHGMSASSWARSHGYRSTMDTGPAGAGSSKNRSMADIRADRFSSWFSLPTHRRSCHGMMSYETQRTVIFHSCWRGLLGAESKLVPNCGMSSVEGVGFPSGLAMVVTWNLWYQYNTV